MEHLKHWLQNLLDSLEINADNETSTRVIEQCGRTCARECGAVETAEKVRSSLADKNDIDELLKAMNEVGTGGGKLRREGNIIIGTYDRCYCDIPQHIKSPIYCNCTQGWAKEVFEKALGKPVEVKLEKAIGSGD